MCFAAERGARVLRVHEAAGITPIELLEICEAAPTGKAIYTGRNAIWTLDWRGESLAVKAFGIPWGVRKWIYGHFRASKAKRSFENASALLTLGLHTPKPLGYVEFGARGRLLRSFYVSEYIPNSSGVFPLRDVLLDAKRPDREAILTAFGTYSCKLHQLGVLHRDYSPGNILIVPLSGVGGTDKDRAPNLHRTCDIAPPPTSLAYRFELVDLNRMSFGALSLQQRMHNLRYLWADDTDLRTIVTGYAEALGQPANPLIQIALRASHAHKARATREEQLKKMIRAWIGKRGPVGDPK